MRPLFRLDGAVARHPAVNAWYDQQQGPLGELARHWFGVLRACGGDVRELLHDGQATACVADAAFAYVAVHAAHVSVGFFQGAALPDPTGLLQGSGKYMRHVKLRPGMSILDEAALADLVHAAYHDVKMRVLAE